MGDNFGALLEDIDNKFQLLIELVTPLTVLPQKFDEIEERLIRIEANLKDTIRQLQ